ncbi:hypothetical protein [Agromyces sp. LHK192]|uniref:hypothetical protein n=1 Tax=Agromyces sp. LHK192 TaxID=2498704 RepID=UPI000FDB4A9F|nr:hypothetical protein [Agromyces sp. LHK192]
MTTSIDAGPLHESGDVAAFRASHAHWKQLAKTSEYRRTYAGWSTAVGPFVLGVLGVGFGVFLWFQVGMPMLSRLWEGTIWGSPAILVALPLSIAAVIGIAVVVRFVRRAVRLRIPWRRWERLDRYARANGLSYTPWGEPTRSASEPRWNPAARFLEFRDVLRRPDGTLIAERHHTNEQVLNRWSEDQPRHYHRSISRRGQVQVPLGRTFPQFSLEAVDGWAFIDADERYRVALPGVDDFALYAEPEFVDEARALFTPVVLDALRATGLRLSVTTWNESARISSPAVIAPDDSRRHAQLFAIADLLQANAVATDAPLIPDPEPEPAPTDASGTPLPEGAILAKEYFGAMGRQLGFSAGAVDQPGAGALRRPDGAGIAGAGGADGGIAGPAARARAGLPKRGAGISVERVPEHPSRVWARLMVALGVIALIFVALWVAKGLLSGDWSWSVGSSATP